jgi:hypothetical protein
MQEPGPSGAKPERSEPRKSEHHLGWIDPVGQLLALRTAVKILAEGKGNFRIRMEKATF